MPNQSKEPTKNKNKQKQPPDKTSKKGDDIHHLSENSAMPLKWRSLQEAKVRSYPFLG